MDHQDSAPPLPLPAANRRQAQGLASAGGSAVAAYSDRSPRPSWPSSTSVPSKLCPPAKRPANRLVSSPARPKPGTATRYPALASSGHRVQDRVGVVQGFRSAVRRLQSPPRPVPSRHNRPNAGLSNSWPSTSARNRRPSIESPGTPAPRNNYAASVGCWPCSSTMNPILSSYS